MRVEELGSALAAVFVPLYRDAYLRRPTIVDDGAGGTTADVIDDVPCRVQIDALSQAQRDAGFVETEVRVIILTDGLADWLPNGKVMDDDEVTLLDAAAAPVATYRLSSPTLDAIGSHWTCRGRVKP